LGIKDIINYKSAWAEVYYFNCVRPSVVRSEYLRQELMFHPEIIVENRIYYPVVNHNPNIGSISWIAIYHQSQFIAARFHDDTIGHG
jgi:hypothetical protein